MNSIVRSAIIAAVISGAALALTACGTSNAATDTAAPAAPASALALAPTTPTVTKVTVPSLAGLAQEVATAKLKAFGLTASITGDLSNPAFGVLTQEPAAATQVEPGIVVKVTVGESPAQATARQAAEAKAAADAEAARVAAEAAAAAQAEADRVAAEQAAAEAAPAEAEIPDWAGTPLTDNSVWNGEYWSSYDENGELIGDPGYTPDDAPLPGFSDQDADIQRLTEMYGHAPTSGEMQQMHGCEDGYITEGCEDFDVPTGADW